MRKLSADFFNARHTATEKIAAPVTQFDFFADGAPALIADLSMNAAIRNDFNFSIGEQHVNHHTVVFFGVPDPER